MGIYWCLGILGIYWGLGILGIDWSLGILNWGLGILDWGSLDGGSLDRGNIGFSSWGCITFDVHIRFSWDFNMDIRFSLGPSLSIFEVQSVSHGDNWGSCGGKSQRSLLFIGNGGNGLGISGSSCVPCLSKFGLSGLNLRGVRNVILGLGGDGQCSKYQLK